MKKKYEFVKGQEVEVSSDEQGFEDSWFVATIIKVLKKKKKNKKYFVEYKTLLKETESEKLLRGYVDFAHLRPAPPKGTGPFHLNEEVNAYNNDGWWKGVIMKILKEGSSYLVLFKPTKEELEFDLSNLRSHLDWVDGKWISSPNQETAVSSQNNGRDQFPNPTGSSALSIDITLSQTPCGARDIMLERSSLRNMYGSVDNQSTSNGIYLPLQVLYPSQENRKKSTPRSAAGAMRTSKKIGKRKATDAQTFIEVFQARRTSTGSGSDAKYMLPFPTTKGKRSKVLKRRARVPISSELILWSNLRAEDPEVIGFTKPDVQRQTKLHDVLPAGKLREPLYNTGINLKGVKRVRNQRKKVVKRKRESSISSEAEDPEVIGFTKPDVQRQTKLHDVLPAGKMREPLYNTGINLKGVKRVRNQRKKVVKRKRESSISSVLENGFASKETKDYRTDCTPMLSTHIEEEYCSLSPTLDKPNSQVVKYSEGATDKQTVAVLDRIRGRPKGSCEKSTVEGSEHEVASDRMTVVPIKHRPLSLLEMSNSPIVKDNEGVSRNSQVISNKAITLIDASMEQFPNETNIVKILSFAESDQYQYGNRSEDEIASHMVNITTNNFLSPIQHNEGSLPPDVRRLPFIKSSILWGILESFEVFKFMPQQPHFRPLEQYNEELREGFAIAHVVNFNNLVGRTWNANLDEPRIMFQNKLEALNDLEGVGFTVQRVRARLEELLRIKDSYSLLDEKSKIAETKVIEEKRKVDQVQESIKQLNIKLQTLMREKEMKTFNIAEQRRTLDAIKETIQVLKVDFDNMVGSPLVSTRPRGGLAHSDLDCSTGEGTNRTSANKQQIDEMTPLNTDLEKDVMVIGDGVIGEKLIEIYASPERAPISKIKRKLLILDLNGLLVDIVNNLPSGYKADKRISRKALLRRPFCDDFLKFCFQRFSVGVWSSRTKSNVDSVVDFIMGDMKHGLVFCWDLSHCTETGFCTIENSQKPLVLKQLVKLWDKHDLNLPWENGEYNESNTLLIDDSPYKALLNPPCTAIFPPSYKFQNQNDNSLGPGGDIRLYLEGLATSENVQKYIKQHPFGQCAITEKDPSWLYYRKVINCGLTT
ncbi:hypothetical protein IFM89_013102 [Coptis chinensis]|uniref:FCP1 homology domain-containing protein n=1 Tax=Coptis chinensis TaxID=261450 RepID=A0A835M5Z1_9MAGN|nr:hypothetical protein IFM89_013102 [Coptis chinensis]